MIIRPDENVPSRSTARTIVRPILSIAHPADPLMSIILQLIHPSVRAADDPLVLSVGRPSPTFCPIVRPTDGPISLSFIRPIIHPNDDPVILSEPAFRPIIHPIDDPFIQSVGRPRPIQSDPSVHPTIFHGNHPNRPPDLTPNSFKSSEEGYFTAMSEWPALLQAEKVTFLFQHLPGLAFKPSAGLGPKILTASERSTFNRSFLTWPAD